MSEIRKPKSELRAYIKWQGLWRHVYVLAGYDQMTLLGEPEKMLEFKLSLKTKISYSAPKKDFQKRKPAAMKSKSRENWA